MVWKVGELKELTSSTKFHVNNGSEIKVNRWLLTAQKFVRRRGSPSFSIWSCWIYGRPKGFSHMCVDDHVSISLKGDGPELGAHRD